MANKTEKEKKEPEVVAENEEVNASAEEVKQITPLQSAAEQKVDNDVKAATTQPATAAQSTKSTSMVDAAMQKLDSQSQPYNSQWQTLRDDAINQLQNRDPFNYDLNGDILYQQYADIYGRNADKAMKDTVGKVSSLSGGYGNSYAQTAGQQAYSETMSGLNDIVPELYQLAQSRYDQEGQELKDMVSLYQGLDESDYNRFSNERDYAHLLEREDVEDERWEREFDESVRQYNETAAFNKMSFEESQRQFNETFSLQEKEQLYNSGITKIMMDKQPNAAECAALGVTPEGAREMRRKYKEQNTASVSTGGTGGTGNSSSTGNDSGATAKEYESGTAKAEEYIEKYGLTKGFEMFVQISDKYNFSDEDLEMLADEFGYDPYGNKSGNNSGGMKAEVDFKTKYGKQVK